MIDFSEEDLKENIEATKKILLRAKAIGQFLEMEVGITGGEEDGKDNEGADKASMSTTKEQIWEIYEALSKISRNFTIAAAFGNVHGVYPKGNVKLTPEILKVHRDYVKEMAKEKFAKHETAKEKLAKHEMAMDKTAKDEIAKDVMTEKEMANYNLEDDKPVFLVFHGGSGSELHKFQEAISYGVVKVVCRTTEYKRERLGGAN